MTARRQPWHLLAAAALLPAFLAGPHPAQALSLPERPVSTAAAATPVSLAIPVSRSGHLERKHVRTYIVKATLKRKPAASPTRSSVAPGQLLWLGVLLTSMVGFALYLGRELTTRFPADERGPVRRV